MALTTYEGLVAAVAAWLARGDLAERIPDFIALAEERIHHGAEAPGLSAPPLRLRAMERLSDPALLRTVPGEATLALPADFLEARVAWLATDPPQPLAFVGLGQIAADPALLAGRGVPRFLALEGERLRFAPVPDAAYGVVLGHYARLPPVAAGGNALLTRAPGVYLYGALLGAQPFLLNDARIPVWAGLYAASVRGLAETEAPERALGGPLAIRLAR